MRSQNDVQNKEDELLGPEELVRRETKVVNFLRAFLFVLLIIVGSFLSFGCYKLTYKWEDEAYRKDFNGIAFRFLSGFNAAVGTAMWTADAIGVAVSASSNLGRTAPNITTPFFDKLALAAKVGSHVNNIFFAPLLHGSEERKQWEAYALQQMNQTTAGSGPTQRCNLCGSPNLVIGTPNAQVAIPGYQPFTCGELSQFESIGLIPPDDCQLAIRYVQANCGCQQQSSNTNNSTFTESNTRPRSNQIFEISGNGTEPVQSQGPYSPIWQVYPQSNANAFIMYDLFSDPIAKIALETMIKIKEPLISKTYNRRSNNLWNVLGGGQQPSWGNLLFSPVYATPDNQEIIGSIVFDMDFTLLVGSDVPLGSEGINIVLENSCGQLRTFQSDGTTVYYVGDGDLHDPNFSSMMQQSAFDDFRQIQRGLNPTHPDDTTSLNCAYRVSVYSSEEFRSSYLSNKPFLYAGTVILIFIFTSLVFFMYDCYVARRQRKVMEAILQRDEIVSSLFPAVVRQRLFLSNQLIRKVPHRSRRRLFRRPRAERRVDVIALSRSEPIADFLPMVSIVFADISGFTAWSSEREPEQVFQLLETVYQAFDRLAGRCGVFKVETTGDCYVAATGIPVYQADHAVRILKFAYECLLHLHELVNDLETTLGPGTSSLSIRIGVHSGPVIAGVLRGEKSRFQLFGDTMNMAARMQTTGEINMIQISAATANVLMETNKSHWVRKRDEQVSLKGKGFVQTFWADPVLSEDANEAGDQNMYVSSVNAEAFGSWADTKPSDRLSSKMSPDDKQRRMVEWNTDLLLRLLKNVVANRIQCKRRSIHASSNVLPSSLPVPNETPLKAATEILPMQVFIDKAVFGEMNPDLVEITDTVRSQLLDYITQIASMYRDNPFHNFEHACHVAMSACKIVTRIIRPNVECEHDALAKKKGRVAFKRKIHNSTFGISSDVLMQFAVVFSAVIHDVDHAGVSNAQLVKEGQVVAVRYDNKCVAEQNSVEIAWNLLMQGKYKELCQCICPTEPELMRFRQLLVNAVIATDIADKELQLKRKKRWDKAFHGGMEEFLDLENDKNDMDRKATIVFEYIIQASDVSHTMQHWKVYKQWNERLFEERYRAYQCGREEQDPSVGWYKGEIAFFDNYIIPLAKKLETCGVFGVSSDEYLSYALENRREWEFKGENIVSGMVVKYDTERPSKSAMEIDV